MVPAGPILFASVSWVLALIFAPVILARLDSERVLYSGAAVLYGLAAWICHQRPDRSFYLEGIQLPVCARCFGAYLGVALGACAPLRPLPRLLRQYRSWRLALFAAGALVAATYAIEWMGAQAGNGTRAITAIPFGLVAGGLVVAVAQRELR